MSRKIYNEQQEQEILKLYREGKTMSALATTYGGGVHTISRVLGRYGQSTNGIRHKEITEGMRQNIIESYPRESQLKIARRLGIRQGRVSRIVRAAGLFDLHHLQGGKYHDNWKGGKVYRQGYTFVLIEPDYKFRPKEYISPYMLEHRLVMSEHLGRPLTKNETVHHINGDRADNCIENLQLRQGRHGRGVVAVCVDCGSYNIKHDRI